MLTIEQLLVALVLVAFGAWFWHHLGIRQIALRHARKVTRRANLQLLDQSIYLRRIRPARSRDTLIALQRSYEFEFATRGDRRFLGWVVLVGRRLERVELQPYSEEHWLQ